MVARKHRRRMVPITILVADDDRGFRKLVKRLLEGKRRVTVVGEAEDGEEAVRLAGELHPDIILMDITMPGTDGLEATKRIKAQHPEEKVIVLTVHDEEAYRRAAAQSGADGFLTKKAIIPDLFSAIRTM